MRVAELNGLETTIQKTHEWLNDIMIAIETNLFWDEVLSHVARKAIEMRRQGFAGAAMLPMSELEYTGVTEKLARLERRFLVRGEYAAAVA